MDTQDRSAAQAELIDQLIAEHGVDFFNHCYGSCQVVVNKDGKYGVFSFETETYIIPHQYDSIASVDISGSTFWLQLGAVYSLVTVRGNKVIKLIDVCDSYEYVKVLDSNSGRTTGFVVVTRDSDKGLYSMAEKRFVIPFCHELESIAAVAYHHYGCSNHQPSHLYRVQKGGLCGIFNTKNQKFLVEPKYKSALVIDSQFRYFKVSTDGGAGVLDTKKQKMTVPAIFFDVYTYMKNVWVVQRKREGSPFDDDTDVNVYGLYDSAKQSLVVPTNFYCWIDGRDGIGRNFFKPSPYSDDTFTVCVVSFKKNDKDSYSQVPKHGLYSVTEQRLLIPTNFQEVERLDEVVTLCYPDIEDRTNCVAYANNNEHTATEINGRMNDGIMANSFYLINTNALEMHLFHAPTATVHVVPVARSFWSFQVLSHDLVVSKPSFSDDKEGYIFVSLAGAVPKVVKRVLVETVEV